MNETNTLNGKARKTTNRLNQTIATGGYYRIGTGALDANASLSQVVMTNTGAGLVTAEIRACSTNVVGHVFGTTTEGSPPTEAFRSHALVTLPPNETVIFDGKRIFAAFTTDQLEVKFSNASGANAIIDCTINWED